MIFLLAALLVQAAPEEAFRARLEKRRALAGETLREVREELARERAEAEEAARALRKRLAGKPVSLAERSGKKHDQAVLRGFTLHDLELDAGGRIGWGALEPASVAAAADVLFDPERPADQFMRGRLFVALGRWTEALEAFDHAAGLGEGFGSLVEEFRKTLEGVASGGGALRRVGDDRLLFTCEFGSGKHLEDFTPGLARSGDDAVLEGTSDRVVFLRGGNPDQPVEAVGELSVEMRVTSNVPLRLALFSGGPESYEIEVGPRKTVLTRIAPDRKEIAQSTERALPRREARTLRLLVRSRRFTISVDGREVLAAEAPAPDPDAPEPRGAFGFGIPAGRLVLHPPLRIEFRADPRKMGKRLGEMEVLVRRALDPEFDAIRRRRERALAEGMLRIDAEELLWTADDPYFGLRIKTNDDLEKYTELKRSLACLFLPDLSPPPGVDLNLEEKRAPLNDLVGKYPDVPMLLLLRAFLHEERQDPAAARADVAKALELFPEFAEARLLDARLRLGEGDAEGALRSAQTAVLLVPDDPSAYATRAWARFASSPDRAADALDDLDLALKLDPESGEAAILRRVLKGHARGPKDLGCRFDAETRHYRVTTDIAAEAAGEYGGRLEAVYDHFLETFRKHAIRSGGRKPRVAIFNVAENYYTYFELISEVRGEHTLGVFRPMLNELVLFESLDRGESLHTLYHEAFHHFMTLLLPRTPPSWFNEGMAEYMGAVRVRDGKVTKTGILLPGRLESARWMAETGTAAPFGTILRESPREFYGPSIDARYAQAWSMIHFFFEFEGGRHRDLIHRYLDALREGKSIDGAYEAVFAPDVETLEREWKGFMKGLKR